MTYAPTSKPMGAAGNPGKGKWVLYFNLGWEDVERYLFSAVIVPLSYFYYSNLSFPVIGKNW